MFLRPPRALQAFAAAGVLAASSALRLCQAAERQVDLDALHERHRWFELAATTAANGGVATRFHQGAVALAFNDLRTAELRLRATFDQVPPHDRAGDARNMLINGFLRAGQYSRARAVVDAALKHDESMRGLKPLLDALTRTADQRVVRRSASRLRRDPAATALVVPVTINGHRATYLVDSGANFSVLTASEAERHGMTMVEVGTKVESSAGRSVGFRLAVAAKVAIGECELSHVAFLVFDDEQPPFNEMPAHSRGAIGLPVLLALETIRWDREAIEFGFDPKPARGGAPNLCFDGLYPVIAGECAGKSIFLVLDTGARTTHLWAPFLKDVPDLGRHAQKQPAKQTHGVGGSATVETVRLGTVEITLGGRATTLAPADIFLSKTTEQSAWYHGNLGMDLLSQAKRVTVNFGAMQVILE